MRLSLPMSRMAWSRLAALGCAVVLVAFAACGVSTATQTGPGDEATSTAGTTPSAMASATVRTTPGAAASTGCPGPEESVTWPTSPAVIVTQLRATVTVKVGQAIELRLPFGSRWSVAEISQNGAFTLDQPAGYADASAQSCIWHFTAKQAGSQDLTIMKAPICRPGVACSADSIAADMTLTATA